MSAPHVFEGTLSWTGRASETDGKLALDREFLVEFRDKAPLTGSSPGVFKGDDSKHNPETLMISSLMACHHLTYLSLCERAGIALLSYEDRATGTLGRRDGKVRMLDVGLHPRVRVRDAAQLAQAAALHEAAHAACFMANSVNFEVTVQPEVSAE